ncbi:Uncharacterized conserved protein YbbK, DUF523 family [Hathewaya proteolytica DSM 3090]|uniref:Uncharacterized conserved protein YbbK, DUF523 family n=1 Tax=Hathewaya proteolytica DSM 3090 TaxID=1121331 RepID=A0A1M6QSP7_9CLOT|nr:DUF523 domain-containing protein [Hathewaya proteolytica]SHK23236.1 Uncharacterized conserved protein YbbK, DUF523 family [Hathewaya proteolytica DSM 3090]
MVVVSACLCGVNCKYNGENNYNEKVAKLFREKKAVLICPEQMGGLSTPRLPCEISNSGGEEVLCHKAKVVNCKGEDCTEQFLKGAEEALNIAKAVGADSAILKSKSPSCGCGKIYDGKFSGQLKQGNGVTAALFLKNGIKVYNENSVEEIFNLEE